MAKGIRPKIKIEMKYESIYLYKAINPKTGENFSLIMPDMTAESMNIFLEKFSSSIKNKKIVLIMDNASSHKSKKLKVPENIKIEYLPPYTYKLNPVESFFGDVKKQIKNKIFGTLDRLEEKLIEILRSYTPQAIKSLTFFDYLRNVI